MKKPAIGPTLRTQVLASGLTIRQDFRHSVRLVFFETGIEDYPYATSVGTAFVVSYQGRCYAVTARHVRQDFAWKQLVITDAKIGKHIAPIRAVYYPSSPREEAVGSDVMDIAVIEFVQSITADFFQDSAYILDRNTACSSSQGDSLLVNGALKEHSTIVEDIAPVFALLQFNDAGLAGDDVVLRLAVAKYVDQQFNDLLGLSGAPVFNETANALGGMVVRAGPVGDQWHLRYIDIFDVIKCIDAVREGKSDTYYRKTVMRLVKTPIKDLPIIKQPN